MSPVAMNRTPIEWCHYSWNPVTGCRNNCIDLAGKPYCYARNIANRFNRSFEPQFHPERLEQPYAVKKPRRIFVCSMGELFGSWVPPEWIRQIRQVMRENVQHTFIILTKNPRGLANWGFPENVWLGVSIDRQDPAYARKSTLVRYVRENIRFISFEPLLERIDLDLWGIDWVIIGGMTGPRTFVPPKTWVDHIIEEARFLGLPIFLKDNLHYPVQIREFPPKNRYQLRQKV